MGRIVVIAKDGTVVIVAVRTQMVGDILAYVDGLVVFICRSKRPP